MKNYISFLIVGCLIFFGCEGEAGSSNTAQQVGLKSPDVEIKTASLNDSTFEKSYDFEQPSEVFSLPLALLEISGLSYYPPKKQLLAVNDERGWLFFINPTTGEVDEKITFGGNGDYEGVEWTGSEVSIIKSNGNLYFYDIRKKESDEVQKTKLNSSNDIEGMAYRHEKNELLIACKGNPNLEDSDKYKKTKAVYRYDLDKGKIKKKPFLKVEDKDLEKFVEELSEGKDWSKKQRKKFINRAKDFSPSGIAIHSVTKDYYLLSSQGKTLIIFDTEKNLKSIIFLDAKIHRQPEGICFAPNGDMYISNEGRGLGAKLMRYDYLKK